MIKFKNLIKEQQILKTTRGKQLGDAIKQRHPITFWYSGPKKEVKFGRRINAEAVALGTSKKGNLIIRAWVQPPSVSKKGYEKHGWRTFMVGRMSNINISEDIFNEKRPGYKEGNDDSMTVTYITSDWGGKISQPKEVDPIDSPEPEIDDTPQQITKSITEPVDDEPETDDVPEPETPQQITKSITEPVDDEPDVDELPQPKPDTTEKKPSKEPFDTSTIKPFDSEEENDEEKNGDNINESIKRIKNLIYY